MGAEEALALGLVDRVHPDDELLDAAILFWLAFDTEDQREGMAAFFEKRPPVFRGR